MKNDNYEETFSMTYTQNEEVVSQTFGYEEKGGRKTEARISSYEQEGYFYTYVSCTNYIYIVGFFESFYTQNII